ITPSVSVPGASKPMGTSASASASASASSISDTTIIPDTPSSIQDIKKKFPVLTLGFPKGFVSVVADHHETWIEPGDLNKPVSIVSLHITTFFYNTPNYLSS
ncbi:MAG: hypothetical protein ACK559_02745, partial [bacterium]